MPDVADDPDAYAGSLQRAQAFPAPGASRSGASRPTAAKDAEERCANLRRLGRLRGRRTSTASPRADRAGRSPPASWNTSQLWSKACSIATSSTGEPAAARISDHRRSCRVSHRAVFLRIDAGALGDERLPVVERDGLDHTPPRPAGEGSRPRTRRGARRRSSRTSVEHHARPAGLPDRVRRERRARRPARRAVHALRRDRDDRPRGRLGEQRDVRRQVAGHGHGEPVSAQDRLLRKRDRETAVAAVVRATPAGPRRRPRAAGRGARARVPDRAQADGPRPRRAPPPRTPSRRAPRTSHPGGDRQSPHARTRSGPAAGSPRGGRASRSPAWARSPSRPTRCRSSRCRR